MVYKTHVVPALASLQPVGGGRHETKDHTNKYVQAVRSDMKETLDVTRTNSQRPDLV